MAAPYILIGADTYGWPSDEPAWSPAQRCNVALVTSFRLTPPPKIVRPYILVGADTYGWPPYQTPWSPPQHCPLIAIGGVI